MTYYKVICDGEFVGIGTSVNLAKHQKKHNLLLTATEKDAECIVIADKLYRDQWMLAFDTDQYECSAAIIQAITEEEYRTLAKAIENGENIAVETETAEEAADEEPEEVAESEEEEVTADYVRSIKLKELGLACNRAITSGFDIELSDGQMHHFSLTLQDQQNLNEIQSKIFMGEALLYYHADGEELKQYSEQDMLTVIGAGSNHKLRHLAYHNCLKAWVNSLVRIKNIQAVEYGSEIPKKYQSALYRNLYAG